MSINIAQKDGMDQMLTKIYGRNEEINNRRHCQETNLGLIACSHSYLSFCVWLC